MAAKKPTYGGKGNPFAKGAVVARRGGPPAKAAAAKKAKTARGKKK